MSRRDPLAILAAVAFPALAAGLVAEPRTLALLWALLLATALAAGIGPSRLALRLRWGLLAATAVALSAALFGVGAGRPTLAAVAGLRVLVFATSGVLWASLTDPGRLARSVEAHLHAPATWALAATAAYRLLPSLAADWQTLSDAQRSRLGSPPRGRRLVGAAVGLLVSALRRAQRLTVAIEARGFDPQRPRSAWHPATWGWADSGLVALAALITLAAPAAARLLP